MLLQGIYDEQKSCLESFHALLASTDHMGHLDLRKGRRGEAKGLEFITFVNNHV